MANKKNLANAIIATPPSPATTGTSIVLQTGYGAYMPDVPFFLTITPPGQLSTRGNSEIINVTARTGDTLTIERAQKGTTAQSVESGWIAANGVYAEDVPITSGTGANVLKDDGTYGLVKAQNVDFATFHIQYGGGALSPGDNYKTFTPANNGLLTVFANGRRNTSAAGDLVMRISATGTSAPLDAFGVGYGTADGHATAYYLATVSKGTPVTIKVSVGGGNISPGEYRFSVTPGAAILV